MKKYNIIYFIAGMLLLATSCTMRKKIVPLASINAQLYLTMSDMEYVGEVKGTATQYKLMGFPYGGRRFHAGVASSNFTQFDLGSGGPSFYIPNLFLGSRGLDNAMYDALMQKPDADFIIPVSMEREKHLLFLGSKTIYNIRGKAFKIRTK